MLVYNNFTPAAGLAHNNAQCAPIIVDITKSSFCIRDAPFPLYVTEGAPLCEVLICFSNFLS